MQCITAALTVQRNDCWACSTVQRDDYWACSKAGMGQPRARRPLEVSAGAPMAAGTSTITVTGAECWLCVRRRVRVGGQRAASEGHPSGGHGGHGCL
jgi:hypothetical protein